jgi:TnpA family transposase
MRAMPIALFSLAKEKKFKPIDFEDQEISVLSLHLLQSALVYVNTLMVQEVLSEPQWMNIMQVEDLRGLYQFSIVVTNT